MGKTMKRTFAVTLALLAASAHAQQAARDSDRLLDQAELTQLLSGQILEFYDNSLSFYLSDNEYEYRYAPGDDPFVGTYTVTTEGSVCVTFENGFDRCDLIVDDGKRYVMIIANGDRYPVRTISPIE